MSTSSHNFAQTMQKIRSLHLEPTTYCNARCPMCARNLSGGKINPKLYLKSLSDQEVRSFFTPAFLTELQEIVVCGSYGEPFLAKDIIPIVEYFIENTGPELRLQFDTNGSIHSEDWWRRLAGVLSPKSRSIVYFGIDGLADTHSIYRRGTSYEKIMQNAAAFINAGGSAGWSFLAFRHNEHQIETAKMLSDEMGFKKFLVKKSGRFYSSKKMEVLDKFSVLGDNGEFEYFLEPPQDPRFTNAALNEVNAIASEFGSFQKYLDTTDIECESLTRNRIYVSADALVLPCGYLNHQLFDPDKMYGETQTQIGQLLEKHEISLHQQSLSEILASGVFERIYRTWQERSIESGRIKACATFCGKKFRKVDAQISGTYGF